jgi:Fe-S oxidoreductase
MKEDKITGDVVKGIQVALDSCEKCHLCNTVCPIVDTRVTQGSFGINRSVYYGLKWNEYSEGFRDLLYSCTTCGKCVDKCKKVSRALPLVEIFEKAREFLLVEKMMGPMPEQIGVLKNMHVRGNPWGNPSHERTKWAVGLDIPFALQETKVDVLYFVGCASSYDTQAQKIAKNLSKILKCAGVRFGILENETSDGHEAKRMGETGLFAYLSDINIKMFKEAGIKHIVTGDPHSFYSFTQEYPDIDNLKIQHSTQYLNDLIEEGKLKLTKNVNKTVTYHDPCYLGRHSGVYEEPRQLIKRVPGVILREIENNKDSSDCCGMGGGRMWMEPPKGLISSQAISRKRIQQALDSGADILVTACPFCNISLSDEIKAMGKEDSLEVMDITTLISMSL